VFELTGDFSEASDEKNGYALQCANDDFSYGIIE
jgi:hypothetical protein